MRRTSVFLSQINRVLIILFFISVAGFAQKQPQFSKGQTAEQAAEYFNKTAKTVLHPAYSFLAADIVERFHLKTKHGIGIDVGGGTGDLVIQLSKLTLDFYWVSTDINPYFSKYVLNNASENNCAHQVGFMAADAHSLPFKNNFADVVVSRASLQFWKDKEKVFREILRVLKPGGKAYIGRGFAETMPLKELKELRAKQKNGMPKYKPEELATELEGLAKKLHIMSFEILRPHLEQNEVNYGVWIIFSKPQE